jgi:hypothetical protein
MANAYGNTTKLFSTPYLTIAEYKQAPTAIDYNNLVVDSADPSIQDAELANVIARASSWIDVTCGQVLAATTETEQQRARLRPDGMLAIHPRYNPVVAVTSLSFGITPNDLVAYPDPSQGWVEDQQFIFPYTAANISYSSQGPLQFGIPSVPRAIVYCNYTYVNGYANTLLDANANAAATTITVEDATGITANSYMTIYDGMNTETIVVASNHTYGNTTVALASPLKFSHLSGVSVSALPPAIKEAAILATTAFLKVRGDYSMTMQVTSQVGFAAENTSGLSYDLKLAQDLLKPFRRVR